jgi:hypothetical protein
MANDNETTAARASTLKKLFVPAAVGVAGSALAMALTKKPQRLGEVVPKLRKAMPEVRSSGIGEITDDLKDRLDSVLGKDGGDEELGGFEEQTPSHFDTSEFERRRAERRERRERRRRRAA